jgi:hypothetical protein
MIRKDTRPSKKNAQLNGRHLGHALAIVPQNIAKNNVKTVCNPVIIYLHRSLVEHLDQLMAATAT